MNCPRCQMEVAAGACPSCGFTIEKSKVAHSSSNLIRDYFDNLWEILFHPTRFFKKMPTTGGLAAPLAFALVTHWIGAAVSYLWYSLFDFLFGGGWKDYAFLTPALPEIDSPARQAQMTEVRDRMMEWMWGMTSVIADPFKTLVLIVLTSAFVYVGARLFVSDAEGRKRRDVTFETATRIVAYGMSPAILAVFPFVGGLAAQIWAIFATVIGARTVYKVSTPRALIIALFPKLLLLGIIFVGVVGLFLLALRLVFGML